MTRLAELLVVIFCENSPTSRIFNMENLFFHDLFFQNISIIFGVKNCQKICQQRCPVFILTFSVYVTIYQHMLRKNDLELKVFSRKDHSFYSKSVSQTIPTHCRKESKKILSNTWQGGHGSTVETCQSKFVVHFGELLRNYPYSTFEHSQCHLENMPKIMYFNADVLLREKKINETFSVIYLIIEPVMLNKMSYLHVSFH